ncbi:MAG TPA: hypothetical protein VFA34_06305 [Actinomycetota bacterium]|nr:hypothetical protein [Actinomycetota bacterium]
MDQVQLLTRFHAALLARDWQTIQGSFATGCELAISGRSPLAGFYKGPTDAVNALRGLADETDLGTIEDDTHDVCTSDYHAILIDWLRAARNGRTAQFYIHLICAFDGDTILRAFASFDSQYEFDDLWSS